MLIRSTLPFGNARLSSDDVKLLCSALAIIILLLDYGPRERHTSTMIVRQTQQILTFITNVLLIRSDTARSRRPGGCSVHPRRSPARLRVRGVVPRSEAEATGDPEV